MGDLRFQAEQLIARHQQDEGNLEEDAIDLARAVLDMSAAPTTVHLVTDGSFAVAFTDEVQAAEHAMLSGNMVVSSELHGTTAGAELIEEYRDGA